MRRVRAIYAAILRLHLAAALAYRGTVVLHIVTTIFPLVMLAGWLAMLRSGAHVPGWDESAFVSYYVAAMVVKQLTRTWITGDWDDDVRTGDLSAQLLLPTDPVHHHIARQLAHKLVGAAAIAPLLLAALLVVPGLRFTTSPAQLMLTAVGIVLGLALSLLMGLTVAMVSFWTTQTGNLYQVWIGLGFFLSGWVVPIELLPDTLKTIAYALPFRYTLGFQTQLLTTDLSASTMVAGLGLCALWTVAFLAAYRVLWRLGRRRYEAVGA